MVLINSLGDRQYRIARLEPRAKEHQVQRACRKQNQRQCDLQAVASEFENRPHDLKMMERVRARVSNHIFDFGGRRFRTRLRVDSRHLSAQPARYTSGGSHYRSIKRVDVLPRSCCRHRVTIIRANAKRRPNGRPVAYPTPGETRAEFFRVRLMRTSAAARGHWRKLLRIGTDRRSCAGLACLSVSQRR